MAGRHRARRLGVAAPGEPPAGQAAALEDSGGLDEEVRLLRDVIRELHARGEVQEARRQIETLCRVLRTRYMLDDQAADSLSQALARSLEEIGRAMGAGE